MFALKKEKKEEKWEILDEKAKFEPFKMQDKCAISSVDTGQGSNDDYKHLIQVKWTETEFRLLFFSYLLTLTENILKKTFSGSIKAFDPCRLL